MLVAVIFVSGQADVLFLFVFLCEVFFLFIDVVEEDIVVLLASVVVFSKVGLTVVLVAGVIVSVAVVGKVFVPLEVGFFENSAFVELSM